MSNLRIIGLTVGILGFLITFLIFRGTKWKRSNFILFSLFNVSLIIIAINPNVVNFVRDGFFLREQQYGRLIALLIVSNIFLLFLCFYTKAKLENIWLQFDKLVKELGYADFRNRFDLKKQIAPIMVLIPALNEAENLRELLPRIPKRIKERNVGILVIDDGSVDETSIVASKTVGVYVVRNPINRGGGAALRLGYAVLKGSDTDVCVTMDADGQHRPEDMEDLA